ncbi:MAG TPA: toll/interleukin-1 receptor domain-containing protein [Pyrinomonadaceae bacterium]|nr:toll/interleukin-1 receptor domain-containing protein [Pyrinomonadaceae bacterium]
MRETPRTPGPVEVFISYSRDEDKELLRELDKRLKILEAKKTITYWRDYMTPAGHEWEKQILEHLNAAEMILLVISPDFLASKYCCDVEATLAMERHRNGEARVIPIILRECDWQDMPFGTLQVLPENAVPVKKWSDRDDAFTRVERGIRAAARLISEVREDDDIQAKPTAAGASHAATNAPKVATTRPRTTLKVKIKVVTLVFEGSPQDFDLKNLEAILRDEAGVETKNLKFDVREGSVKVVIEGDGEALSKIIARLRDPEFQRDFARRTRLLSVAYVQEGSEHTIPVETAVAAKKAAGHSAIMGTMRAFPAARYALVVAGIAAAVAVVAGFTIDFRIAIFGVAIMLALALGLVDSFRLARRPSTYLKAWGLTLTWTFVLLTSAASFGILSGFFFSWPRPLQAYLPQPTPSPTPRPSIRIIDAPRRGSGPDITARISGKVSGVNVREYKVVLFARTDKWFVQPYTDQPSTPNVDESATPIQDDGSWENDTHLGSEYAALLVKMSYKPPTVADRLPDVSGTVLAIARVTARD